MVSPLRPERVPRRRARTGQAPLLWAGLASGSTAAEHRRHCRLLHRARKASGSPVARAAVEVRLRYIM